MLLHCALCIKLKHHTFPPSKWSSVVFRVVVGEGGRSKVYNFESETDDHWKRAVLEDTTHSQGGTECAPVPSGLGMNRVACGSGDKGVSVDGARRNTHTQERAGVNNARERTRTSTGFYSHQHLKLARLPIPPLALKGLGL